MKAKWIQELMMFLSESEYRTAEFLAEELNVSKKTVRNRIKELNGILSGHGAIVQSKHHYGYKIEVADDEKYQRYLIQVGSSQPDWFPVNSEERVQYMLAYLLSAKDFVKMDELSESLYVSTNTLSRGKKRIRDILQTTRLREVNKPHYGMRLEGMEQDKRLLIVDLWSERFIQYWKLLSDHPMEVVIIENWIVEAIRKWKIQISETAFEKLVRLVWIMASRVSENQVVTFDESMADGQYEKKDIFAAEEIVGRLEDEIEKPFPKGETQYLAMYMASLRSRGIQEKDTEDKMISASMNLLVADMLKMVRDTFKIDLMEDLELRVELSRHMVPLDIRLKEGIYIANPMLEDVKQNHMFAYMIASQASIVLKEYYKKELPESETGYLALLFALALARKRNQVKKKNVLIICSTGKSSAKLLSYRYLDEFGKYIESIQTCDVFGISDVDFSKIDYAFSTVPIDQKLPVPVLEIEHFLEHSDIAKVKKALSLGNVDFLLKYYREELFLTDVPGKTKEEVLAFMCDYMKEKVDMPEGFYEAVLKRETLARTDFGNLIALPHPYKTFSKDTFVCVGILKEPIQWVENPVQVVFLVSISDGENEKLQEFYQLTTSFLWNREGIQALIEAKSFYSLIHLLGYQQFEESEDE